MTIVLERATAPTPEIIDLLQALDADLRRLIPQVTGAKLRSDDNTALAGALIEAGWVPGARRRGVELPNATAKLHDGRPLTVPISAEQVLGLKRQVVGWVWPDPEHVGDDGRWRAVHGMNPERVPHFVGPIPSGRLQPRDMAIGWVLEQDKEARRG